MYTLEDIKLAYNKLKSYIYYDNNNLLLRQKLIEFETDTKKDSSDFINWVISPPYSEPNLALKDIFNKKENTIESNLEIKFNKILTELNDFKTNSQFLIHFYNSIETSFFPKKFKDSKNESEFTFITNTRKEESYSLERVTAFINIPIEIHLFSVMWIIKYGFKFDSDLLEVSKGNRLVLNKDKTGTLQNSSLFKPYFTQYQNWRDESVSVAQDLLKNNKNALIINIDIKDYFHSTRIDLDLYFPNNSNDSLNIILRTIHEKYSELLKTKRIIQDPSTLIKSTSILPIGLLSSFVIANHYLSDFDKIICQKHKPSYYGRYVDDILIVFSEQCKKTDLNPRYNYLENSKLHDDSRLSEAEKRISEYLYPTLEIKNDNNKKVIKINGYESLFCQPDKTLIYYFDYTESDLVIDKLKQELNERSSEFRDLPDDNEQLGDFDKNAFYLNYTDSIGKIRTLKDYKVNRYGLTLYLTNKVLGAIKHNKIVDDDEIQKLLKIFSGKNCLEFYTMWEKIFTYLLVNNKPNEYAGFYFNCLDEIQKIRKSEPILKSTNVNESEIQLSLINYLDCAHELVLSLNPRFLYTNKKTLNDFLYQSRRVEKKYLRPFDAEITNLSSPWIYRYRKTNMMRHHYVSIPLLNYTKESYDGKIDLIKYNFNIEKYTIDEYLIKNSPRPIKFWECTISQLFTDLKEKSINISKGNLKTNISDYADSDFSTHFLDIAFNRFELANLNHKPLGLFDDKISSYKKDFFDLDNNDAELISIRSSSNSKIPKPKISVANTFVKDKNILDALRNKPNISNKRYQQLVNFLKSTRKDDSNIVVFPEFFLPIETLSSLIRYSEKNDTLLVTGLEHITVNNIAYNFIVTILPVNINGYKDATVVFRLKNHYAPNEEDIISGNHLLIPEPENIRYHIFNWRNIYFSVFYCFELANISHRSLIKNKIDLLITVEYNKDVNYFSNLIESISRDLHCYVIQVNSSHFGDTRISQPTETCRKDIVKIKGGENPITIIGTIEIDKLREFQRKKYNLTKDDKDFKVLPPDFKLESVIKRINNENPFH